MRERPLCMLCLICLLINGIQLWMKSGEDLITIPASSIFSDEEQRNVSIQGQVYKKSNTTKNQVLYLKNNSITYQNQIYYESKIIIYDSEYIDVSIGQTIELHGTVENFSCARNPGNFDQKAYYAKQDIYGFCYLDKMICVSGQENVLSETLYQFRQNWKSVLLTNMSEENGPILSAMLLAEKTEMDQEVKELYQKNGISHVLAISGLHISFIGMGIYQVLRRRLGLSYVISGVGAICVLGIYVLMIGMSVSVVRAFLMLFLRIGADMAGRVYDVLTALLLSATILVVYQPLHLTDAAFWMSHGAILGIVLVLPRLKKFVPRMRRYFFFGEKVWEGCLSSVAINIALFPILLYFYYEIPIYSVLVNILVIPLMSVVLSCGMFGSFWSMLIPVAGKILLGICDVILNIFAWISMLGCRLPFSSIVLGQPKWWQMFLYYGVLMTVIVWNDFWCKRKRLLIGMLILTLIFFVKLPNGKLQITMLDVGQGDCLFIKGPKGSTYLVDGGSSDINQVGKYRIEPYLKSQGVGCLDYVFLSHGDSDHCNGIVEMLERQEVGVKIKTIVLPTNYRQDKTLMQIGQMALKQDIPVLVLETGECIEEEDMYIRCLQPSPDELELSGNAGSMVLELVIDDFEMLLCGDVEAEGEELLIEKLEQSYDVLKVSHHGSKNSTTEEFLEKVNPKLALISAGKDNFYGHPHYETLKRLENRGSKILETEECGAIMLEIGKQIKIIRWINHKFSS